MSKTDTSVATLTATLEGIRPIMFDRYAGDNNTKLKALDKLYTDNYGGIVMPVLNVLSLLTAQNTDSVSARFYGKQRRDIALGVNAYCNIVAAGVKSDEIGFAPIMDESGAQYRVDDQRIRVVCHVARVKKAGAAIPNPKERPMLPTGWRIKLDFLLAENNFVSVATLRNMVEQGGILGLGTFRPMFGRYRTIWHD